MNVTDALSAYYEKGKYLAYKAAEKVTSIKKEDITEGINKVTTSVAQVFRAAYNAVWPNQQAVPEEEDDLDKDWQEVASLTNRQPRSKKRD